MTRTPALATHYALMKTLLSRNRILIIVLTQFVLCLFAFEKMAVAQTTTAESLNEFRTKLEDLAEKIGECDDGEEKHDLNKLYVELKVVDEKTPLLDLLRKVVLIRKSNLDADFKAELEESLDQLVQIYFGPDVLDKEERKKLLESAKESQKWSHDDKLLGYRLGGDGTDGYIDCSHHVCKVYTEAGYEYSYLNVEAFVASARKKTKGKFVEVRTNQAKIGDVIVYLKADGNPFNHMGVVSRVSQAGEVTGVISATERGKQALNRDKESFKPSIVE